MCVITGVIDSDKCSGNLNAGVMKELAAKPSIMLPLIKSPGKPQPINGGERAPRILIPIVGAPREDGRQEG